ncbi:putative disease resistance protein RGA1 [Pistacia vera]|uniref:putative disease resistance protein RGA1 n=1 Tax=Pistacia vera TaxID=55513 RepID=UPI001262FC2B|nr:putative disease resistance protein RGA1 [Pistacia vera]
MAEALVSFVLEQLASIARQELRLVAGVDDDIRKLTSNFQSIRAVLEDAESRQFKDIAVRNWLDKLKEAAYDIDDVLDEWNTSIGKLQLKEVENASNPMIKKWQIKKAAQLHSSIANNKTIGDRVLFYSKSALPEGDM